MVVVFAAVSVALAAEAPVSPPVERMDATRYVLLKLFHGQAVYEEGNLLRREIVATYPSTYGLAPDHPLVPLFLYQAKLFDTHERLMKEDPAYRELVDRAWREVQPELPLAISQYEGREILYRRFLRKGVYERLLREAHPPPALPPVDLGDPRGEHSKPFFKKVETDVPKVDFPASLMIFRYCSDGVKYNVLARDPFREAHDRLVAKDGKYREAIKRAMAGLDGVTASDARLTLQFRQALLDAGIDKLIEAEASKGEAHAR